MRTAEERMDVLDGIFTEAASRGLMLQTPVDERLDGRTIDVAGHQTVNFGSCSYLGLEMDERLREGVIDAVGRYGTQFSSSRSYVSAPLYAELEGLLADLFGGPTMVAASTSLGHVATLPVVVGARDAVILDQQVHHSVTTAANLLRPQGTAIEMVRHNRMDMLEELIEDLVPRHERVWYLADGVYSMFADVAPVEHLAELRDRYEQLHLYIDDSHGMSWTGRNGRGHVLDRLPSRERTIVAASLNKAFAAAGGAFIFPDEEMRRRVTTCGGTMIFSGPVQPPMLGAAIASARIHLSPEIERLQAELRDRIDFCNALMAEHELPLVSNTTAPIRYVGCGLPRIASKVAERLLDDGFYVNLAPFPAVPMKRCGVRTPLTVHHSKADIRGLVEAMAFHLPRVLDEEGSSLDAVREAFGLAEPGAAPRASAHAHGDLRLESAESIDAIDAAEWDSLLGDAGAFSADGLRFLESAFQPGARPEDAWDFRYYVVRDAAGKPVAATFFTAALWKDDMLAPAAVSARVEEFRADDRYHLSSRTFGMGSLLTEGAHLYLDRDADWRGALDLILAAADADREALGAEVLALRDFDDDDLELRAFFDDRGLTRFPAPEAFVLDVDFADDEEFLGRLSYRARRHQLREVLPHEVSYEVEVLRADGRRPSEMELDHLYQLYRNVHRRGFDLNVFDLPQDLFGRMVESPCWELVLLRLRREEGGPADGRPVAFGAQFVGREHCSPTVVGLDYRYVRSHGAYRQALLQVVRRARELSARRLYLGMGAPLEKLRFGARAERRCAFVRAQDHYSFEVLANIEAEVAAGRRQAV